MSRLQTTDTIRNSTRSRTETLNHRGEPEPQMQALNIVAALHLPVDSNTSCPSGFVYNRIRNYRHLQQQFSNRSPPLSDTARTATAVGTARLVLRWVEAMQDAVRRWTCLEVVAASFCACIARSTSCSVGRVARYLAFKKAQLRDRPPRQNVE
jgi:hypothetical protein